MNINWGSWLLWGFASTIVLTSIVAGSQGFGITRMNVPYLLGTMFTPDRDRAKLIGIFLHFANGWIFSFVYFAVFQISGRASWGFGAAVGLVRAVFILGVGLPALTALNPGRPNGQLDPTLV